MEEVPGKNLLFREVRVMPLGDGTGPQGFGPMTGRGLGYCAGYQVPGYMNPYGYGGRMGFGYPAPYAYGGYPGISPYLGRGRYPGFGYGFGRGMGRVLGFGRGAGLGRGFGMGRGRGRGLW